MAQPLAAQAQYSARSSIASPAVAPPVMAQPAMLTAPVMSYASGAATPPMMSYAQATPFAAAGVDVNHDGRANYMYVGADRRGDGIPDALGRPYQAPVATMPMTAYMPGTAYATPPGSMQFAPGYQAAPVPTMPIT